MATITVTIGPVMAGMTAAKSHSRISTINTSKFATQLGFATSEFSGMKISIPQFDKITPAAISAPLRRSLQPVSRRVCPFTGKKSNKKNLVSHSNHRTITRQFVNLQYKKIWWEAGKRFVKLRLSTNAIKTIEKNGLDAMAKKAGIDLRKL